MRRGFTMIELAVVVTLIGLFVPLGFLQYRNLEADHAGIRNRIDAARAARTLSEALRRDLFVGTLRPGEALVIDHPACGELRYALDGAALQRIAPASCGGSQTLATQVSRFTRNGASVELELTHAVSPDRRVSTAVRFGLVVGRAP